MIKQNKACLVIFLCTWLASIQAHEISLVAAKQVILNAYGYPCTNSTQFTHLPDKEIVLFNQKDGAPQYGEVSEECVQLILDTLKITSNDVFYDLGCGTGKICLQVLLTSPIKKSVGIELSHMRITYAQKCYDQMKATGYLEGKHLELIEKNIAEADFSDATIIYMHSVAFPDTLMKKITKKLTQLNNGLYVLTTKPLPENKDFEALPTINCGHHFFWYQLQKK